MATNTLRLAGGACLAAVLGLGLIALFPDLEQPDDANVPQGGGTETLAAAEPVVPAEPVAAAEPSKPAARDLAPFLDTILAAPDGVVTLAGQAAPGSEITIIVGGERIVTAEAGADGAFALVTVLPPSDTPRRLSILARQDGVETRSVDTYTIAPTLTPPHQPVLLAEAVDDADPSPLTGDRAATPILSEDAAPAAPPDAEDAATDQAEGFSDAVGNGSETSRDPENPSTVALETGSGTSEVESPEPPETPAQQIAVAPVAGLQPEVADDLTPTLAAPQVDPTVPDPAATVGPVPVAVPVLAFDGQSARRLDAPETMDNVALDTITYDPAGDVLLSGRASGDGFVQVYIDNRPVTTSRVVAGNTWRTDLPDIDSGIYTLRIDELDAEGAVVSRIETPFKREEPADVVAAMAPDVSAEGFDIAVRTVQPGNTLWAIAEERFGEGIMYVAVFEANRDLIRDADLIYPGQVFQLPALSE